MVKLKFIQINIYKGKYLDALIDFLKIEKPDFISMQEVTAGMENLTGNPNQDLFKLLKKELKLNGVFNEDFETNERPKGVFGNAVLTPNEIIGSKVFTLKKSIIFPPVSDRNEKLYESSLPRHILDATINFSGRSIHIMSVHGAWTVQPVDTDDKLRQARLIAKYLKYLGNAPYILGGDLNMPPGTKTIDAIDKVSNNLMLGSKIRQTTHPKVHKIAPAGLLVDYIYISKHFKPISIKSPIVTVSDHLPVIAKLELLD